MISDLRMPGEDGYSLIAKVRALGKERGGKVPAAALTAYVGEEDRIRVLQSSMVCVCLSLTTKRIRVSY